MPSKSGYGKLLLEALSSSKSRSASYADLKAVFGGGTNILPAMRELTAGEDVERQVDGNYRITDRGEKSLAFIRKFEDEDSRK